MPDAFVAALGTLALAGGYDALKAVLVKTVARGPSAITAVRQMVMRDTGADLDEGRLEEALARPEVIDALFSESPTPHQWGPLVRSVTRGGSGIAGVRSEDLVASLLGALVVLIEQEVNEPDAPGDAVASVSFDPSVRARMAELERTVEYLTNDQYRIIAQQRHRKVRISGVAGSGKTLVAIEKARRLDAAGFRTLLLCHNPGLAAHMADVLSKSRVDVMDFRHWIDVVNGHRSEQESGSPWSPHDEPTSAELESAFYRLLDAGTEYQAVLVDEGQDFRGEWWTVVEAAIDGSDLSALFIFHDDMQALVPHRAEYPPTDATFNLDRNCRNSGEVYEAMRRLMAGIPQPDPLLQGSGVAQLVAFDRSDMRSAVRSALLGLDLEGVTSTVIVTGGSYRRIDLDPHDEGLIVEDLRWQWAIRRSFGRIARADRVGFGPSLANEVGEMLAELSTEPWPTATDANLIRRAAKTLALRAGDQGQRQLVTHGVEEAVLAALSGQPTSGRRGWSVRNETSVEVLGSDQWLRSLPHPRTVRLSDPAEVGGHGSIPVYTVAQFKGLEADNVLAIWDSASPEPLAELFVAVSRARAHLVCMIASDSMPVLPDRFRVDVDRNPFADPELLMLTVP